MIYIVVVADRHKDPEPFPFVDRDKAILFAREEARTLAGDGPFDIDEYKVEGRELTLDIGPEGDAVWVVGKEMQ